MQNVHFTINRNRAVGGMVTCNSMDIEDLFIEIYEGTRYIFSMDSVGSDCYYEGYMYLEDLDEEGYNKVLTLDTLTYKVRIVYEAMLNGLGDIYYLESEVTEEWPKDKTLVDKAKNMLGSKANSLSYKYHSEYPRHKSLILESIRFFKDLNNKE